MKKHFLFYICTILALCIALCGCSSEENKYDTLISAIENEDYTVAVSEFNTIVDEILAEQKEENANTSSESEDADKDKIKTVGITTENFFDYFYIEKIKVPCIINSKKTRDIEIPSFITLKNNYTLATSDPKKQTQIAIEFSANYTTRYALVDFDLMQFKELYETTDSFYEEPFTDTVTIMRDRTSLYSAYLPSYHNVTEDRHFYDIFDSFELIRAIGTLYLIEE